VIVWLHDLTERIELTRRFAESQEKYQNIVENSLDGIVIVQDGKLVYVNPSAARIFGYASAEEMKMMNFTDTVAPASKPFVFASDAKQTFRDDVLRNYEIKGLTKQGRTIDLEVNAQVVTWNGTPAVQASFRDITDRKMLEREQALWLWEQETLSSIDRKLMSTVDLQRILDTISKHAQSLIRADFSGVLMVSDDANSYSWKSVRGNHTPVPPDVMHPAKESVALLLSNQPVVLQNVTGEQQVALLPLFQNERLLSVGCFPLTVGGKVKGQLVVGFRSDHALSNRDLRVLVSLAEKSSIAVANAQLYESLAQHEQELKMLSGARIKAQEEERRRIAREIHDSLGQMLTAIKFNVEILEDLIPKDSPERRRIDDTKSLLDATMAEARKIAYNLMPSVLDDFGLVPALQLLCDQFAQRTSINVEYHAHGLTERLEPTLEVSLYRIVQEALNNIAKHAEAKDVSVQVVRHAGGIRLTIEDSGKGFDVSTMSPAAAEDRGMGLVGMRERAASFKGTVMIDSAPNSGTTIVVEIPLPAKP
jgi:PAS domain S-box-containing protein